MLSVAEATQRVIAAFSTLPDEYVTVGEALGRTVATDVVALRDQPPMAVSAMDGYAVRASDLASGTAILRVVGAVPAGQSYDGRIEEGEAVRIFTGAPLPNGADSVAIQENAQRDGDAVRIEGSVASGTFVRPAGLDYRQNSVGVTAGTVLNARHIGLAASMGHGWLAVRRRPRVAVLATGDELVRPGASPAAHQITSSNSATIAAMVRVWGGEVVDLGICKDCPSALSTRLAQVAGVDLVVTSGGASVGDHDLVSSDPSAQGLDVEFWKVAMRPGKPLLFGRIDGVPLLGLPGNPVSAAVCSLVYVRAALRRLLGLDPVLPRETALLAAPVHANDQRQDYLRAVSQYRDDGTREVWPAERQDSSMLATLALADCLIVREPHASALDIGASVPIVPLDDAATTI